MELQIRGVKRHTDPLRTVNIQEGDRVMLSYWGDPNVPKALDCTWATVLRIKKTGSLLVEADVDAYGTRTIVPDRHVWRHISIDRILTTPNQCKLSERGMTALTEAGKEELRKMELAYKRTHQMHWNKIVYDELWYKKLKDTLFAPEHEGVYWSRIKRTQG